MASIEIEDLAPVRSFEKVGKLMVVFIDSYDNLHVVFIVEPTVALTKQLPMIYQLKK